MNDDVLPPEVNRQNFQFQCITCGIWFSLDKIKDVELLKCILCESKNIKNWRNNEKNNLC